MKFLHDKGLAFHHLHTGEQFCSKYINYFHVSLKNTFFRTRYNVTTVVALVISQINVSLPLFVPNVHQQNTKPGNALRSHSSVLTALAKTLQKLITLLIRINAPVSNETCILYLPHYFSIVQLLTTIISSALLGYALRLDLGPLGCLVFSALYKFHR